MKKDVAAVLARNLSTLMAAHASMGAQGKVAQRAKMDQRTVGRILSQSHSPTLRQLDKLAEAFELLPWQMLVPDLDSRNPPAVTLTRHEQALYQRLTTAAEGIVTYKVDLDTPKAGE